VNLVADESLDRQIVERLRRDGHTVSYIAEMEPGVVDETVLHLANREQALLLTADKDFGELVFRQHRLTTGVVLLRLAGLAPDRKASLVARALAEHSPRLVGAFTVITPGRIRIRSQQTP
jgi:predicted nuclease of predicted toxin-antitoxin system